MGKKLFNMAPCWAYKEDGTICRKPAVAVDYERGCNVCEEHLPKDKSDCRGMDGSEGPPESIKSSLQSKRITHGMRPKG